MSAVDAGSTEFSAWRAFFWPIHRHEARKLVPMLGIFFLLFFDYNLLRTLKDSVVVTSKSAGAEVGAEVIPFIKVWVLLPGALIMTYIFTRLSNRLSREMVFYSMTGIFLVYFFLFGFVLYPCREALHCDGVAANLQAVLPAGFKGFISMVRNWTCTTYYVMSELWGAVITTMLLWGFANDVTKLSEAKRFYGIFGIGVNISGAIAGQAALWVLRMAYNPNMPFAKDHFEQTVMIITGIVIVTAIAALWIYRWMQKNVLIDERYYDAHDKVAQSKKKIKLSMRDTFRYLMRSKYLLYMALMVVTYNIVINLTEVMWKQQVREMYPDSSDYTRYMSQVTSVIGVIATLMALFVSGNSIRRYGWTVTAMLTPAVLFITSIGFFSFFFLKEFSSADMYMGLQPLAMVVFFGSAQNAMSRASKYTVFDATKEMAYVPLSEECKLKGKAAIDGVCSRLGKSGGSMIYQCLLLVFTTINASAPLVAVALIGMIVLWMFAIKGLGKQFHALSTEERVLEVSLSEEAANEELLVGVAS